MGNYKFSYHYWELQEVKHTQWTGKEHRYVTYRYVNHVPLKDDENSIEVNWVEITITNEKGEVTFHTAFITSYLITEENVTELVKTGRCRWKIENEDFNNLKTKGYHFEHNFGYAARGIAKEMPTARLCRVDPISRCAPWIFDLLPSILVRPGPIHGLVSSSRIADARR